MYGMDFWDAQRGLVSGYDLQTNRGGVFLTLDAGATWQLVREGSMNDTVFLDSATAVTIDATEILRSTDGGLTWQPTGASIFTGLFDLEVVTPEVVVGVSGAGDVWRSRDRGTTWTRVLEGKGDLPGAWAVEFSDQVHGTVVGVSGYVFRTSDGGLTWQQVNRGIGNDWDGIAAFSDGRLAMVGHHGYIQTSGNLGGSFEQFLVDPPVFLRDTAYYAIDTVGQFGYVVGAWGGIARTFDSGHSWQNLAGIVSLDYVANDIEFTDPQNGWMVGFDYTVGPKEYTRRTTDGGTTWVGVPNGNVPAIDVEAKGNNVWIQTTDENHWRSTDGGDTFQRVLLPSNGGSSPQVRAMSFADSRLGYVVGSGNYIVMTTDAGATWRRVGTNNDALHLDVLAVGDELWTCGLDRAGGGVVSLSRDRGATWQSWAVTSELYPTPEAMVRVGRSLFACGYAGGVWRIDGLPGRPAPSKSQGVLVRD